MKYRYLILIFLIACSSSPKDLRVQQFENFIGFEKMSVIDKSVSLLDSVVTELYKSPDINSNYQSFLIDIAENKINWKDLFKNDEIEKLNIESKSCGLWNEIHLDFQDAFYRDGEIISKFSYVSRDSVSEEFSTENRQIVPKLQQDSLVIDSLIQEEKSVLEYNPVGKYIKSLELIKNNDTAIINYLDSKKMARGTLSMNQLAEGFRHSKADFSDYFVRRIFAIEILL